jgi:hypothetical protein
MQLGPSSTNAASGGIIDLTPRVSWAWADELTFYVTVIAANGSPTGGALVPKFQLGMPYSSLSVNSGNQFSAWNLVDLDNIQKGYMIAEGEDWPSIAYNVTKPYTVSRTIRNFGDICNLQLDTSSLSGGTSPTLTVSVTMTAKAN